MDKNCSVIERKSGFYLRIVYPKAVRQFLTHKERWISLKTKSRDEAHIRAAPRMAEYKLQLLLSRAKMQIR